MHTKIDNTEIMEILFPWVQVEGMDRTLAREMAYEAAVALRKQYLTPLISSIEDEEWRMGFETGFGEGSHMANRSKAHTG